MKTLVRNLVLVALCLSPMAAHAGLYAVPDTAPGLVGCPVYLQTGNGSEEAQNPDLTGTSFVARIREWDDSGSGTDGYYWTGSAFQASDPGALTTTQMTLSGQGWYADVTGNTPFDSMDSGMVYLTVECGHALDGTDTEAYPVENKFYAQGAASGDVNVVSVDGNAVTGPGDFKADVSGLALEATLQNGTYGLPQLVRATTPANTLNVDGNGRVDVGAVEGGDATDYFDGLLSTISGYINTAQNVILDIIRPITGTCTAGSESDADTCQDASVFTYASSKALYGAALRITSGGLDEECRTISNLDTVNDSVDVSRDFSGATDGLTFEVLRTGGCG